MLLSESNPYLHRRSEADRKVALRVSAQTSSAVEGIRAPFSRKKTSPPPASREAFIAYWQQRSAANAG